jgi:hypothetical protein
MQTQDPSFSSPSYVLFSELPLEPEKLDGLETQEMCGLTEQQNNTGPNPPSLLFSTRVQMETSSKEWTCPEPHSMSEGGTKTQV